MWKRSSVVVAVLAMSAWAAPPPPSGSSPSRPPSEEEGAIEPKADEVLQKMSTYLAGLNNFRVKAVTVDEKITTDGQKIQELKQSVVAVSRPGKLRVDRVSANGHAVLASDGKMFTLYNADKNAFLKAPSPARLDEQFDVLRDRLNLDAPGEQLIVSDPYHVLIEGLITGRYIGLEPIDDVMAHHIAVTEKDTDWQLWIKDGAEPLPLRMVVTSKDMPGHPEYTLQLSEWETAATLSTQTFVPKIPPGAKRIEAGKVATPTEEGK